MNLSRNRRLSPMMLFLSLLASLLPLRVISAAPEVTLGDTILDGGNPPLYPNHEFFRGIPYAKPPVDDLRLRPPEPIVLPSGRFNATQFGKACVQPNHAAIPYPVPDDEQGEDCLTINILRPAGLSPNASLPVMFWTYGGGFFFGASSQSPYIGNALVRRSVVRETPIIYVSFNYRLGPLGFPQGVEAEGAKILNLGLEDQWAALAWVKQNIGAFGGNSSDVTAFGESAGAIMTSILYLKRPLAEYVKGTILQSGTPASATIFNATYGGEDWQEFVHAVPSCAGLQPGDPTLPCLRNATSSDIETGLRDALGTSSEFNFKPTLDGPDGLIPDYPSRLLANGNFARVPFIAGANLDDGTVFTNTSVDSAEWIRKYIIDSISPPVESGIDPAQVADALLGLYPDDPAKGSPFNTGNETFGYDKSYKRLAAMLGDVSFQSLRRAWNQAGTTAGVSNYAYSFEQPQPIAPRPGLGVYHSAEIPFAFGTLPLQGPNPGVLTRSMMDYWISFAVNGDPNDLLGEERPKWSEWHSTDTPKVMRLIGNSSILIDDTYRADEGINYINENPLAFHH